MFSEVKGKIMAEEVKNSEQTADVKDQQTADAQTQEKKSCKCFFANNKHAAFAFVGIVGVIVGLIIGLLIGGPSSPLGTTTVPESKLDETIATYKYNGDHKITIRELMEAQGSIDLFKTTDKDGKEAYRIPSSEAVTSYVRNQVLIELADSKGIKVSDDEVFEMLKKSYNVDGQEGLDNLAKQFGTTPEKLKDLVVQQIKGEKLVRNLMGDGSELPEPPTKPEAPAEGQENKATAEYADYIRNLVGDAWNNTDKKWADDNSSFAKTLVGDNAFNGETATYTQANIVYSIVAQEYQEKVTKGQTKALDEINAAMANTSLTLRTLAQ